MKKMLYILMLSISVGLSAFASGACCCDHIEIQNDIIKNCRGSNITYQSTDGFIMTEVRHCGISGSFRGSSYIPLLSLCTRRKFTPEEAWVKFVWLDKKFRGVLP